MKVTFNGSSVGGFIVKQGLDSVEFDLGYGPCASRISIWYAGRSYCLADLIDRHKGLTAKCEDLQGRLDQVRGLVAQ